jgi:hypothetical protein
MQIEPAKEQKKKKKKISGKAITHANHEPAFPTCTSSELFWLRSEIEKFYSCHPRQGKFRSQACHINDPVIKINMGSNLEMLPCML